MPCAKGDGALEDKGYNHAQAHPPQLLKLAAAAAGVAAAGGGCAPAAVPPTPAATATLVTSADADPTPYPKAKPSWRTFTLLIAARLHPCAKYRGKTCEGCLGNTCVKYCTECTVRTCAGSSGSPTAPTAKSTINARNWRTCNADWQSSGFGSAVKPARAVLDQVNQARQ